MATPGQLMATGVPGLQAALLGSATSTGLVATGTTKATALVLVNAANVFATVSSGKSALLPSSGSSAPVSIYNGGSNPVLVYAQNGETINALSSGATFSVTNGKGAVFSPGSAGWVATLSA